MSEQNKSRRSVSLDDRHVEHVEANIDNFSDWVRAQLDADIAEVAEGEHIRDFVQHMETGTVVVIKTNLNAIRERLGLSESMDEDDAMAFYQWAQQHNLDLADPKPVELEQVEDWVRDR